MDAAARLGYEHRPARRPRSRGILNILVMIPSRERPHTHLFFDTPELLGGIGEGFAPHRIHTIASPHDATQPFDSKKLGDIDGCIVAFTSPADATLQMLKAREIPVIAINRTSEAHGFVADDPGAGIPQLLARLGAVRPERVPTFVGLESTGPVGEARRAAFEAAAPKGACEAIFNDVDGVDLEPLLREGRRAFVCVNDLTAVSVYTRVTEAGMRVPADVSILGYDASPVARLLPKRLTTIRMDVGRLGMEAARLLRELVIERRSDPVGIYLSGELIEGETT